MSDTRPNAGIGFTHISVANVNYPHTEPRRSRPTRSAKARGRWGFGRRADAS
jgi:hypothetical protein